MASLRKLIAGNWKMNNLAADGQALAAAIGATAASAGAPACDLLVCPPATILRTVAETLYYPMQVVGFWDYQMDMHLCPQEERRQACPQQAGGS